MDYRHPGAFAQDPAAQPRLRPVTYSRTKTAPRTETAPIPRLRPGPRLHPGAYRREPAPRSLRPGPKKTPRVKCPGGKVAVLFFICIVVSLR